MRFSATTKSYLDSLTTTILVTVKKEIDKENYNKRKRKERKIGAKMLDFQ